MPDFLTLPEIASDVRFGTETEFLWQPPYRQPRWEKGRRAIAQALEQNGLASGDRSFVAEKDWLLGDDDSIVRGNAAGYEARSPILCGAAGLQQLFIALETLCQLGCTTNESCGFHIHLSKAGPPLTVPEYRNFLTAARRQMRRYCRSISPRRIKYKHCYHDFSLPDAELEQLLQANDKSFIALYEQLAPRHTWKAKINLCNMQFVAGRAGTDYKTTVEFKGREGVNFDDIPATIQHLAAVVNFFSAACQDPDAQFHLPAARPDRRCTKPRPLTPVVGQSIPT